MTLQAEVEPQVQVRCEELCVVVLISGALDREFGEVLGTGLVAATDGRPRLMMDVSRLDGDDLEVLRALACVIDIVAGANHVVAVRGASGALQAYLRLRDDTELMPSG